MPRWANQYIQRMYHPIRDIAEKYNIMQAAMASSKRISEERMTEAARRVRIASFIEGLPAGYREEVQERGITFSQGQRQRLSFARTWPSTQGY